MQLKPEELKTVAAAVQKLCGVILDASKGYLIETRLGPIAKAHSCSSFVDLFTKLRSDAKLRDEVVDAITTHETLFFRDQSPFEALQHKALPEMIDDKSKSVSPTQLRLWSAACSTGQEPYSLSIVLHEMLPDVADWDIKILATDISAGSIEKASRGLYSDLEMQRNARPDLVQKYFEKTPDGWRVNDSVRSLVHFRRFNLLEPLTSIGYQDVVLCRNVSIYFDADTRSDLFHRIKCQLPPHGYLFVGAFENLADLGPEFAPSHHCKSVFFRPNMTGPVAASASHH